jgi:chromosome segregation ATPase
MKPRVWLALISGLLVVAAGVLVWQVRTNRGQARRLEQVATENQQLKKHAADLTRQLTAARAAAQARKATEPPPLAENPAESQYAHLAEEQSHMIQNLQDKLAQANASINQLESRILDQQGQVHQLNDDKQRLAASESDLRDTLESANRLVNALQKELKTKNDRIVQIEISNQKLRDQSGMDSKRLGQITKAIADLQQIHRRQETTLKSILGRYRDVTDQYRSLSGMLESRRGDPGVINTVDLSRIQDSIALAEEDLRQFSGLTAQAQLIARKITSKSP